MFRGNRRGCKEWPGAAHVIVFVVVVVIVAVVIFFLVYFPSSLSPYLSLLPYPAFALCIYTDLSHDALKY